MEERNNLGITPRSALDGFLETVLLPRINGIGMESIIC